MTNFKAVVLQLKLEVFLLILLLLNAMFHMHDSQASVSLKNSIVSKEQYDSAKFCLKSVITYQNTLTPVLQNTLKKLKQTSAKLLLPT